MHSSYQLNTVFTDVILFTPTELQVSSSCNMTNQPLFLRYNPAVEPVLRGARREGGRGSHRRSGHVIPNDSQTPHRTSSTAERKPMGNKSVYD